MNQFDSKNSKLGILCSVCKISYKNQKQLNKHKRNIHKLRIAPKTVLCAVCKWANSTIESYRQHLKCLHNIDVLSKEILQFSTKKDFETWLLKEEKNSKAHFILPRGERALTDHKFVVYVCNRSGYYTPKGKGTRNLKAKGSVKIGLHCTAGIQVKIFPSHVEATYHKDHFGHERNLDLLPLSIPDRKIAAGKALNEAKVKRILKDNHEAGPLYECMNVLLANRVPDVSSSEISSLDILVKRLEYIGQKLRTTKGKSPEVLSNVSEHLNAIDNLLNLESKHLEGSING